MSSQASKDSQIIRETIKFLDDIKRRRSATPRTRPPCNPPQSAPQLDYPVVIPAELREQLGEPIDILGQALAEIDEALLAKQFLTEPQAVRIGMLIATARHLLLTERRRPTQSVTGHGVAFRRETTRRAGIFDLAWWRGDRA